MRRNVGRVSDFDPNAARLELSFVRRPGATPARSLQRAAQAQRLVRLRAGVFTDPGAYRATSSLQRYRGAIAAVVQTRRRPPIVCGESAAAIWGLPRVGVWPADVELMSSTGSRPRSRNGVRWRCPDADPAEIVSVDGMLVTDVRRTLADLCVSRDFANAVVALDHGVRPWFAMPSGLGVRGCDAIDVLARVEAFPSRRGQRAARRAIAFCDPRAANAGESLSRVRICELGFPPPDLQVPMPRSDGPADLVDFDWPDHELFGEFDGRGKYFSAEYTAGLRADEILMREKVREDRIRRRHRRFAVRWGWAELMKPQLLLLTALLEAGLPRERATSRHI